MTDIIEFLAKVPAMSPEQLMGLIALTALGLAIFAIYVVFSLVIARRGE